MEVLLKNKLTDEHFHGDFTRFSHSVLLNPHLRNFLSKITNMISENSTQLQLPTITEMSLTPENQIGIQVLKDAQDLGAGEKKGKIEETNNNEKQLRRKIREIIKKIIPDVDLNALFNLFPITSNLNLQITRINALQKLKSIGFPTLNSFRLFLNECETISSSQKIVLKLDHAFIFALLLEHEKLLSDDYLDDLKKRFRKFVTDHANQNNQPNTDHQINYFNQAKVQSIASNQKEIIKSGFQLPTG